MHCSERFNWVVRTVVGVAVLLASRVVGEASAAQVFPGLPPGFGEALQPDFSSRDTRFFVEDLQLDEGQKAVLESLIADYDAAFKAGADKVRQSVGALDPAGEIDDGTNDQRRALIQRELESIVDQANEEEPAESPEERTARIAHAKIKIEQLRQQLKELNPEPPRGDELHKAFQRIAGNLQTWQAEKARLRDEFVTNAQAVLKDEQKERWPALSRKLTRERTLNKGRLSGESIDLFRVVKEMNFTPQVTESISAVLVEYDLRLDAALQARNSEIERSQQQMMQATQVRDVAALVAMTERLMKAREAVRNVNDDHAVLIAAKLPADLATTFATTVRTRAYPRVYRPTQTQRLLKAAEELEGLEAGVLAAIRDLEKAYLVELGPVNDRVREVVRTNEVADQVNRAAQRVGPNANGSVAPEDPIGRAFQERNKMGQAYADRLKGLLTEEQWKQLPTGQQNVERAAAE